MPKKGQEKNIKMQERKITTNMDFRNFLLSCKP
jgi:hypothetical protein